MKTTPLLIALAASTAVLAGCGSGTETAAPAAAPQETAATTSAGPTTAPQPAGSTLPAPVADPDAEVDADDQSGDGTTVVVREARLTVGPGWVAIRTDDDDNGGRLLGSAPVTPGQTGPITVTLTEPVPAGGEVDLTAVLHLDDGDGAFDETLDPRVLDDDDRDDDQDDDDIEDDDFDYRVG